MRSLARNVASEASERTLATDTGDRRPLHRTTVSSYLDVLRRPFVVEELPAWSADLRSRARLCQNPKRLFVDPSLAVAALRAGPERLDAEVKLGTRVAVDHAAAALLKLRDRVDTTVIGPPQT